MRRRYGWLAPMFLNYDFTFLALLLAPPRRRFPLPGPVPRQSPAEKDHVPAHARPWIRRRMRAWCLTWWQLTGPGPTGLEGVDGPGAGPVARPLLVPPRGLPPTGL